ncbi:MAG TPA: MFS transporter [Candidatus Dormibacteraeota bacterium]
MGVQSGMNQSRWLSLLVLCCGFLLIVVDITIVNVALPSIGRDLGFDARGLAWVINGYLVAFAGLLLLSGRLADLVGPKRVFLTGLVLFVAASAACGLAPSRETLVAARFIQGAGGAASSGVILAMIVNLFPTPGDQARAFGLFGVVASAGAAVGLVAGGLITSAVSWHWIFFVNVPLGVVVTAAAWRLLPAVPGVGLRAGADVPGAVLVTGALMLGVYAIVAPSAWAGVVAVAGLVAFVVRQLRAATPILPLRVFRSRVTSGANGVQALLTAGFMAFFFLGSLDLQRVLGYGPLAIGLAFLPVAVTMGAFSARLSAAVVMRYGAFRVMLCGEAVIAAALLMLALGPVHASYPVHLLLPLTLLGLGGGLCFPSLTMIAMAGADPADAGLASGLFNTTGQVGGALGVAVLAAVAAVAGGGSLAVGIHTAWLVGSILTIAALALSVGVLRPGAPAYSPANELDEEEAA